MKIIKLVSSVFFALITVIVVVIVLPEPAHLGNDKHSATNQKIVIIPMTGIPIPFLKAIEINLESQHKTDVLVTTAMGKGNEMLIVGSDQYNAGYLARVGKDIGDRLDRPGAFYIVLTNEDINDQNLGFRYVFSSHYDGISVVSLARISSLNYGGFPRLEEVPDIYTKMLERSLKLINKALGLGLYGYEISSNINSVMYGPIMGLEDLDRVGSWY